MKVQSIIFSFVLVSLGGCAARERVSTESHSTPSTLPSVTSHSDVDPLSQWIGQMWNEDVYDRTAIEFLDTLKATTAQGELSVGLAPKGWPRHDNLPRLVGLLDSTTPCAGVKMIISSYVDTRPSTIGIEAAFLIKGYRKGQYPPELNSPRELSTAERQEIQNWWSKQRGR